MDRLLSKEWITQMRTPLVERLRAFRPGPRAYAIAFCVGATIGEYARLAGQDLPTAIGALASALGVNLLADIIGDREPPPGLTAEEIAQAVQERLERSDDLPAIRTLLREFRTLQLALETWQQAQDERFQRLVDELSRHPLAKPSAYVSVVWEPLQPYREAVIDYLTSINYNMLFDQRSGELPVERQLELIKTCDLFVGIYAHDKGALPELPPGRELPLPIDELNQARQSFQRCLIYVADNTLSNVTLSPPSKPVPGPEPVREKLPEPKEPSKVSEGLIRLLQTIWSKIWGQSSPDEIDHERLVKYYKELSKARRKQEELNRSYLTQKARYDAEESEKKRIYDQQYQEYKDRIKLQKRLLSVVETNFPYRRFTSPASLVAGLRQDLDALERGDILGWSHQDVLDRWRDWVVHHKRTLQAEVLDDHPLSLTSPVESHLGRFLDYAWHEEAEKRAWAVVAAAEEIASFEVLDQAVRDRFEPYCQVSVNCRSDSYPIVRNRLIEWCSPEESDGLTAELKREVEQLRDKICGLPDAWTKATKSFRWVLGHPMENDNTWKQEIKKRTQEVIAVAEEICDFPLFDESLQDKFAGYCASPVDLPTETAALISSLRIWCPARRAKRLTNELTEEIEWLKDEIKEVHSLALALLETWEYTIGDFHKCVIRPLYGRCLLVMGRTGSGKTHLVARLLDSHERIIEGYELYCLYVPFEPKTAGHGDSLPIDQVLKDTASFEYTGAPNGPEWRSFEELARFVSEVKPDGKGTGRLVVILDDLDLWVRDRQLDLEELHRFIELHTTLYHVYWVLCLPEADYSLVAGRDLERFWGQYGFMGQRHMPTPSGWTGLDALNEQTESWNPIVCYKLGVEELPPNLTSWLDKMSTQLLTNPFIAWLVGDVIKEKAIEVLPNLNYIDFVEEFRNRRLDQLLREKICREDIRAWASRFWRAIYLIAALVVEDDTLASVKENTVMIEQRSLPETLVKADHKTLGFTEEIVKQIIKGLTRMVVLVELEDLETVAMHGSQLRLEVLPLWHWQSGKYLAEQLIANVNTRDHIEAWLRQYFKEGPSQVYMEGVLEFLLLLLARGMDVVEPLQSDLSGNLALLVTWEVFQLTQPYESVLWLAASKANAVYQYQLASGLERHGKVSFRRKVDLHRHLYFLKYAELPSGENRGVSASLRLQLLRPHYSAIQDFKYGEYFQGFLSSLVEKAKDGGDVARAFAYLYGIENFLDEDTYWPDAEHLATWTYVSLERLAMPVAQEERLVTVHQWMLEFLGEVSKLQPSSKEYEMHWMWMIRHHCKRFATGLTIGDLTWLEKNRWFRWPQKPANISDNVLTAMEEQLTVTCGRWFREEADQDHKTTYVEAVDTWADELSDHKRVALFLIYHTVPAEGPYSDRPVDEDLWEILERLHEDPDEEIQRLMKIPKIRAWYERQEGFRTQ